MPRHPPCALNSLTLRQAHSAIQHFPQKGTLGCRSIQCARSAYALRFTQYRKYVVVNVLRTPSARLHAACYAVPAARPWLGNGHESGTTPSSAPTIPHRAGFTAGVVRALTRVVTEWWSRGDSNPRLPPCKGGALPTELRPRKPRNAHDCVVGHPGLEPGTSVLSGLRSNRLS